MSGARDGVLLRIRRTLLIVAAWTVAPGSLSAQLPARDSSRTPSAAGKTDLSLAPATVVITPVAHDEEIRKRLQRVLVATQWFTEPRVRVDEDVVFLEGRVATEELKSWAGDLARNTQGVVAVVNRMVVPQPSPWDFRPASSGLLSLWRDFIRALPFFAFGLVILGGSLGASVLMTRGARVFLATRIRAKLLRNVVARAMGVLVVLFGVYVILRILGLTQLALTVVGGTGLIGLAVGIAFREITENFLASIFLSVQRPFETGDLIEVSGVTGFVQQLNLRTTVVMTLDGNLVQVPNAAVYRSNLRNFTTNCNRREDFSVGIGYTDTIEEAQEIARRVLMEHPAVLRDPEPLVLVDNLGTSTVNLRVYFWLNGHEHSWLKVRSSVIRLVKREFQHRGISMPDEAREILFPQGVAVTMLDGRPVVAPGAVASSHAPVVPPANDVETVSTRAEAGLSSEARVIEAQAKLAQPHKGADNLLQARLPVPVPS